VGASGARAAQPVQVEEARALAADILRRPTSYIDAIAVSQRSLILRLVCSQSTTLSAKQIWEHIQYSQKRPKPALAMTLQVLPSLRHLPAWFPGANFQEVGDRYFAEDRKVWTDLVSDVRRSMEAGKAPHSILSNWLQMDAERRYGVSLDEMAFAAGNLLTAGGEVSWQSECKTAGLAMCSPLKLRSSISAARCDDEDLRSHHATSPRSLQEGARRDR
jgi:hypothetical protein